MSQHGKLGCTYPKCGQFRYCTGPKSPKPFYIEVGERWEKDGDKSRRIPIMEPFERCPVALVEQETWMLIEDCRRYLIGMFPRDFTPSAQFADAVTMVVQAEQWQKKRSL